MKEQYGDFARTENKSEIPEIVQELMKQVDHVVNSIKVEYTDLEDFRILVKFNEAGIYEGERYSEFWTVAWTFTIDKELSSYNSYFQKR